MKNSVSFKGLFYINFAVTCGFGALDIFMTLYVIELGAKGFLVGAPAMLYALTKIICGLSPSERLLAMGSKKLLIFSLLLFFIAASGYFITENLYALILFRILHGFGTAVFRPVLTASLSSCTAKDERGRKLGLFDTSFYAALGIGPAIGGTVKSIYGFKGLFALVMILSFSALITALFIRIGNIGKPEISGKSAVFTSRVIGMNIFIFGRGFGIASFFSFLPLLACSKFANGEHTAGIAAGLVTLVSSAFITFAGRLADRMDIRKLIISGGTGLAAVYCLLPGSSGIISFTALCCAAGFFSIVTQPACSAALMEKNTQENTYRQASVFNSFMNMGYALGALSSGLIYSASGTEQVYYTAALVGITCSAASWAVMYSAEKSESLS
ncbi:MFS transporter [Seleniivibrio sp.]|uniref:MFS transporter n=1 Tax=Seleniivibrio sp. TaxID=2898801 RepID=UPI0025D35F6D|nr:MFS transporter [Seleniivibrio sp.]MCD8554393.1 MFS transporter [Seleniivibrio sp.]